MSVPVGPSPAFNALVPYELERLKRIERNNKVLEELGVLRQATLFEAGLRAKKGANKSTKKSAKSCPSTPLVRRSSARLCNQAPEHTGLTGDEREVHGHLRLADKSGDAAHDEKWAEYVKNHRCDSQSRGSVYDSKAGICCHFCRQKKLCGEPDCRRCTERNPEIPCLGKSECTRCKAATGRFCRACLLVRYGLQLEQVRADMEAGTWLCPHCYEEDHPSEGWICNSSICMTRRGMKPTGIAIFEAQQKGFASVAHFVQAQILARKGKAAGEAAAAEPAVATQQADQPASAKAYKCHASQKEKLKAESAAAQVISKEDSKAAAVCVAPISDAATAGAAGQAAPTLTIGAARACPTDAVKAAPSCAASSQAMASVGPAARDQGAPTADADDEAESAAPHTLGRNGNAHAGAPKSNVTPIKRPLIAALSALEGRVTRLQKMKALHHAGTRKPEGAGLPGTRSSCRRLLT